MNTVGIGSTVLFGILLESEIDESNERELSEDITVEMSDITGEVCIGDNDAHGTDGVTGGTTVGTESEVDRGHTDTDGEDGGRAADERTAEVCPMTEGRGRTQKDDDCDTEVTERARATEN